MTESDEGIVPTYFDSKDIPKSLAGGGHNQAIRAWQELYVFADHTQTLANQA